MGVREGMMRTAVMPSDWTVVESKKGANLKILD